jgi:hypothetical protein
MTLVAGVVAVNLVLLAAGYCVLSAALAGRPMREWGSYAGVALLVGAGLVGVALFVAAVLGATTGPVTFVLAAALVAVAGVVVATRFHSRTWLAAPRPGARRQDQAVWERVVVHAAWFGVTVIAVAAVVGGFRSSPWLDDAWGIWLPKGIALVELGLDERLFVPNGEYVYFEVPDYPLWWSILTGLDVRLAGDVDVRAMNAQLALLTVAFAGAAARLLWGLVRPWLLWTGLLLVVASPELLRHVQSGMADLPLAIYLALFLLAGGRWLAFGAGFDLLLAFAFAATTLSLKTEGLPELLLLLAVGSAFVVRREPRRVATLWAAAGVAVATLAPWLLWRAVHGVEGRVALRDAADPAFLGGRADRAGAAAEAFARHLADPTEWLLVVPLALALSIAAAVRGRSALWLAPAAVLAASFAFWTWAFWSDRDDVDFLVATASYRVVDTIVLAAGLAVPVLAERLLSPP